MNKLIGTKMILSLTAVVLLMGLFMLYKKQAWAEKISGFGKHQGYSEPAFGLENSPSATVPPLTELKSGRDPATSTLSLTGSINPASRST